MHANTVAADAAAFGMDASAHTAERMGVQVGSLGLLVPWDGSKQHGGCEVLPLGAVSRIPNTVSWCRGLANVRGALLPVIDTAHAFGFARAAGQPTYLLVFGHGEAALGLVIDGLPRPVDVAQSQRLPELPEVPALLDGVVNAAYESANRIWLDVDAQALFDRLARDMVPTPANRPTNDTANNLVK